MRAVREKRVESPTAFSGKSDFKQGAGARCILDVKKTLFRCSRGGWTDMEFDGELFQAGDGVDGKDETVVGAIEDKGRARGLMQCARGAEDSAWVAAYYIRVF